MKLEHFVFGMQKDGTMRQVQSKGVQQLFRESNQRTLMDMCNIQHDGIFDFFWHDDLVLTVSKIATVADSNGRSGKWIHTIFFKLSDLYELANIGRITSKLFKQPQDKISEIEPLEVNP